MDILVSRSLLIKLISFSTELQLVVCLQDVIVTKWQYYSVVVRIENHVYKLKKFLLFIFFFNFLYGIFFSKDMKICHDVEIITLALQFSLFVSWIIKSLAVSLFFIDSQYVVMTECSV